MCRIIENELSLALNIDYKFKADLNVFFRATNLSSKFYMCAKYHSCTIKFDRVIDRKGRGSNAEFRTSRIPEKANAICPPTFSGVGIKNNSMAYEHLINMQ
jgi:hypothetical protein